MKKIFALVAACMGATVMVSCGQGSARLTTDMDSLAYAIGVDLGHMAFQFDSTINPDIIGKAIKDVFKKNEKMEREEAGAYIREYMMVGRARKNQQEAQKMYDEAIKKGAVRDENSGLVYLIEEPGNDLKPQAGDSILVQYVLSLPDGQEIERSTDRIVSFVLSPGNLIPAWIEGMPKIGEGGKITLFVPPHLHYGGNSQFGPEKALKFDIELFKVVPAPAAAE